MATEEMKKDTTKTTEETKPNPANTLPPEPPKEEKKGFLANLGLGTKIALGAVATAVVGGVVLLVSNLLGGKNDDEPEAISDGTEETTTAE